MPPPAGTASLGKMLLLTFIAFWAMFDATIVQGQGCPVPAPGNVINQPSFEDCAVAPGMKLDGAINNGCSAGWQSAKGTPSICNAIPHPFNSPPTTINAPGGVNFACLGSSTLPTACRNEAMFQTVTLCPGAMYQLTFQCFDMEGTAGTVSANMTNGLVNLTDTGQPCFATTSQPLGTLNFAAGAQGWVQFTSAPFVANPNNNQLVIWINDTVPVTNFDVGFDLVSLVCVQSSVTPQITSCRDVGGGQFEFDGGATAPPGVNVSNWCWNFGDGTSGAGQNVTHTYSEGGTYTVCLTVADNCANPGCSNTICKSVTYDPCACAENSTVLPLGVQNYAGPNLVESDIILRPGTHLTITDKTLNINTGCKFVVMRGASLTVDNSTLVNACDGQRWQGIVVWGNSAQNHDVGYRTNPQSTPINGPGIARIRSNSHIEGASTALEPQRWWSDPRNDAIYASIPGTAGPIPSFWGGQVYAQSSTFFNNRKSGDIGAYLGNNLGLFTECTFTSSNPVTGNNGLEGVNLWNTNGVQFLGCTFHMVPARGITTIDAGITVYRTTFQNNYQGIKAASVTNPLSNTTIGDSEAERNYFYSNTFGISSDGITGLKVRRNTFSSNARAGISVSGNSSFEVEGNYFAGHPTGVALLNTGFASQRLLCNSHQDDRAIRIRGYCRGMQFNDNAFDNQTADLHISQSGGLLGDIFLNQGSNGAARLNQFSENESDNDIVTEPNQTVFFRYYPPTGEQFTPAQLARMLPDCDNDDGCAVPNNYHNEPVSKAYSDCDLPQSPPGGGDALPCATRECLDSLNTRLAWLNQQIAGGQNQHQADADATELRFVGDKIDLVGQWLAEGNISLIEQTLNAYNTLADKQLLFAVYTKRGNLSGAAALLTAMPESTEPEQWYKSTQGTYLQYLAAPGQYQATAAQDSVLELAGVSTLPVGANARAMYYLLHGVWLEPDIEGDGLGDRKGQIPTAVPVVNTLQLLPNPANATVEIMLSGPPAEASVQIMDAFGGTVLTLQVNAPALRVSTADLPAGFYFIRQVAHDGHLVAAARLIVQH